MRPLVAACWIAALFFSLPVAAATEALDATSSVAGSAAAGGVNSGCMIAAPGVPATLTGFGLMVVAIALGHRRRS